MSFVRYKDLIEAGDTVMLYQSPKAIKPVTVVPGEVLNNKYGHFRHDNMVSVTMLPQPAQPGHFVASCDTSSACASQSQLMASWPKSSAVRRGQGRAAVRNSDPASARSSPATLASVVQHGLILFSFSFSISSIGHGHAF
jgi:hypothetical protein